MSAELTTPEVRELLDGFATRALRAAEYFGDDLPDYFDVAAGGWAVNGGWTEGLWPGLLWRLYSLSRDERLAEHARRTTRLVARMHANTDDHDLGFLFEPSCVLEHEFTGSKEMLPHAISAAERLAARFLPAGRYIPAHGPIDGPQAGFAIIDSVMNLQLLFWAARFTGESRFAEVARATATTIARHHVRANGSSCQVLWLDPASGAVLRREAVMAASVESCWSRGQAWGIHGFAQVYRETGDDAPGRVAERMAGYFLSRIPVDGVVFHDLDDPRIPDVPRDTSAQAIAADGLLILAEMNDGETRHKWLDSAERLLAPLVQRYVIPDEMPARPRGFLAHGCKSLRKQQGVVSELVFGDYYFVSALGRWLRLKSAG